MTKHASPNKLNVVDLVKSYSHRKVVDRVSFSICSGECVGLLGPNGAGKTTAFYIVVGLCRPTSGDVLLNNKSIGTQPLHRRSKQGLAYLPQEASVFRHLSVEDNLMAILQLQKGLSKTQRKMRCHELLDRFRLQHVQQTSGCSLSGGERRRVEIARALAACHIKFLLLDEPFAGIDPISILDLKTIIKELTEEGLGILITDHNVRETLEICHRASILNEGKIIADGRPADLLQNSEVKRVYLGETFNL